MGTRDGEDDYGIWFEPCPHIPVKTGNYRFQDYKWLKVALVKAELG